MQYILTGIMAVKLVTCSREVKKQNHMLLNYYTSQCGIYIRLVK